MKNSSDFARDILVSKDHKDILACDQFVPFLIQKYISGASPEHCNLINSILNTRLSSWRDEQEIYDFLKCIIPKKGSAFFKYFGKSVDKKETKVDIAALSASLEISKKEVTEMLEYFPDLQDSLKEDNEKILKAKK
jgi:hypothetical protein